MTELFILLGVLALGFLFDLGDGSGGGEEGGSGEGTEGDDELIGGAGPDLLLGLAGDDTIMGGDEEDTIEGGTGNDFLDGEEDNDVIRGGAGDDTIEGGVGDDTIDGGAGNDHATDAGGNNAFTMGDGDDTVEGSTGHDTIDGGGGHDLLLGWEGLDVISGGAGNDTLDGTQGVLSDGFDDYDADALDGEEDDDVLILGNNDTGTGGDGDDVFHTGSWVYHDSGGNAAPVITDFMNGSDSLVITTLDGYGGAGDVTLEDTSDGVNVLLDGAVVAQLPGITAADVPMAAISVVAADGTGGGTEGGSEGGSEGGTEGGTEGGGESAEGQLLTGDDGANTLEGLSGDDTLYGEAGDDTLLGGLGADYMEGGAGNDVIDGTNNVLDGGEDDQEFDTLIGGDGDDTLILGSRDGATGGAGADTFVTGTWVDGTNEDIDPPYITDYTDGEDTVVIMVPAGYAGAGEIVLEDDVDAPFDLVRVLLDGILVAHLAGVTAADVSASSIATVEAAA
ncbi:calcium-binding protein [Alisedimentitalea sp. MJ-SS2]|uniref:calcium-binding protein n=1 Tax=Aliisedimentitalea sp. MJ-SS2 TaxID=3049795 RepID=UPI00290F735A|nr:calcium-binding protein [Alisedimentitalea sp. MJ-SS2]MDU8926238.1 calcium-binding protein [Alisedimentitalea sp. MJ-SS2]